MPRIRRLAVVLGLAILAPAATASARPFYVIQSGGDAWTVMDPQGIEAAPATAVRKAWAVRVQRNILSGNPPQPGYVRTLTEYDCGRSLTRWREFSAYSRAGGLLVSKVNPNPEWGPASEAPDTYAAYRTVCEGGGGGAVVSADTVAKVVISLMAAWDPPPAPPTAAPPIPTPVAPGKVTPPRAAPPRAAPAKPVPPKPATSTSKVAPKPKA